VGAAGRAEGGAPQCCSVRQQTEMFLRVKGFRVGPQLTRQLRNQAQHLSSTLSHASPSPKGRRRPGMRLETQRRPPSQDQAREEEVVGNAGNFGVDHHPGMESYRAGDQQARAATAAEAFQ